MDNSEKIKLVQEIGNDVCEDCNVTDPVSPCQEPDCGIKPEECFRIGAALTKLDVFLNKLKID